MYRYVKNGAANATPATLLTSSLVLVQCPTKCVLNFITHPITIEAEVHANATTSRGIPGKILDTASSKRSFIADKVSLVT